MKVFIYLDTGYEKTTHDMCDKAEICKNQNSDLKKNLLNIWIIC